MKSGILEVLLVHAEGIRHTNLVGTPAYYVIMQCGNQVHRSKVSLGKDKKACWNEKFSFEFPLNEWHRLTHLKFRIMDEEFFTKGGLVGETIIYLGGMVAEGIDKKILEVKPAPYNVVLEDDTYKGEIKIGFKFITDIELPMEKRDLIAPVKEPRESIRRSNTSVWNLSWCRSWFYCNTRNSENEHKEH